jgi:propionyl-CoA carboxylase alpha chain
MMAKVISHGKDRESARIGLVEALNGYHIEGIATNIDFINTVLCHPDFVEARLSTGFIGNNFQRGNPLIRADGRKVELAALAATLIYHVRTVAIRESVQEMVSRIGLSRNQVTTHSYMVRTEDEDFGVSLQGSLQGRLWTATVNGRKHAVETPGFEFYRRRLRLNIDGRVHRFRLRVEQSFIFVAFSGITRTYEIYTPKEWALLKYMPRKIQKTPENILSCPMPGQVVQVLVKRNDVVFRGQTLVILESMKMESGVASPLDGLIEDVVVKSGQTVEAGETLIVFSKLPG